MSIVDRVRSLSPGRQMAVAAVTALVIAFALGGLYLLFRPRYEVLFRDLRPADAATIVAQLDQDQKPYKLADGGATILAPASDIDETRLAIMGADLPLKGTVGFELFNRSDMGLTEFAQRINYQRALQGELARTIMTIEAIETARVHLTLPEPSIFRGDRRPAKASVTLTTRPGRDLPPDAVIGIQRLVAASAPDLEIANVVVLDAQGGLVSGLATPVAVNAVVSPAVQQARAIEQYYMAALRRALEPIYPGVRVSVVVPAAQWASYPDWSAAAASDLEDWAPNRRAFRLEVAVSSQTPFTETQQDDVGRIATDVAGLSSGQGDVLTFPAWTPGEEAQSANLPPAVRDFPVPEPSSEPVLSPRADLSTWAWTVAVVLALAGLVLVLSRRSRQPAPLTPRQREAYVDRLKRLLAEEAGHGG